MVFRSGSGSGIGDRWRRAFGAASALGAACLVLGLILPLAATQGRAATATGGEASSKIRIAFAGDSIVDNYWSGIERIVDANACLKNTVELGRFARNGTGLTRGDRVYWPREIKRIDDVFKPTLSVVSIGLNDRQFIVDGNGARTAWGAPDWTDKYRHELDEFLKAAVASKAVVLMVGMPAMREAIDNTDIDGKNAMFADAIAALGDPNLRYIEPWRLHAAGTETFASYGPDKSGRLVQIRTPDGQHFTVAGEDLAAGYLFPKIVEALDAAGKNLDQCLTKQSKDEQ
ncbi:MAG TPA: DUF459 domain-containing protein [Xanthobacteraceae bacterium]|nr:DUF459 domain-containing protein [Xanthobacteraceae bacterium]